MECSAIGTFAENRTGTFLYWKYVIPWDCLLLQTASIITGFYSQKKRIIRRIISLPVQRYNRLIKILDKPPIGGHVSQLSFSSWNIFYQFKLILMIYGSFASLYNVPSTLMCLKTSRKTLISAKSLNFSTVTFEQSRPLWINILLSPWRCAGWSIPLYILNIDSVPIFIY